jgi:thymidylate kinase
VLDKGEIAPSRIDRAVSAAGRLTPGEGLAATVDQFFDRRIIGHLRDLVLAGEFDQVPALQADLATMWAGRQSRLLHLAHGLGRRREPRLARPVRRGLSVAVMGPDGSGKTTLLRGLQSDLPVPTRYRYQGLWSPGRWDEVVSRIPGARLARMLGRVVGARVAAGYHRARGRVVLMDRTALDALLPGPVDRSLGGRITRAVAHRCTPEHDLVIVLDAPGAEMFRRKGEHTPDQLEVWRQGYLAIAADLPRAVVLDATRSPEQVRSAAGRLVWQSLTGKVA